MKVFYLFAAFFAAAGIYTAFSHQEYHWSVSVMMLFLLSGYALSFARK